ncbi:MAG: polysaccharide biosynthesis tyrosine autokinase [Chitinophagaceae bacterium]|nr:polysaccharide biosynthesis tyrosine autokinase [Chitinophagaceae bacterium]
MEESINSTGTRADAGGLSLKDLFYKYIRFLPYFILSVAIALLAAFMYLRYADRSYSSVGSMQIKSAQGNQRSDKVEDLLSGGNRSQNIQSEIEVISSRPLMKRVVQRLNLQFSITAVGRVRDQNVYGQAPFEILVYELKDSTKSFTLNVKFIDDNKFRLNNSEQSFAFGDLLTNRFGVFVIKQLSEPAVGQEYRVQWRPLESVARSYASAIKVQPKGSGTGILTVSMEANNPRLAADIINSLMVQYDSLTVEQKNHSIDQRIAFIDGRLHQLKGETDSLQEISLGFRDKNNVIDAQTQTGNSFAIINEADRRIMQEEIKMGLVDYITDYLKQKANQFTQVVVPSALGLEDIVLNDLISGYNRAQLERKSLLESNIPPGNPAVREIESLIEQQRQSVLENLKNIKVTYLDAIGQIRRNTDNERTHLKALPGKMKELLDVDRQINTKLALYSLLEGKREEAAIERAATTSNSTIIDQAGENRTPVKPNKNMIQLIAIVLGIGIPAAILFIAELMNDKIQTRNDIERMTEAPIIGEIGHSYSDSTLVVNRTSRSMVAEQFRTIRSNLDYVLTRSTKFVCLITSSFSGEGKSFVSTNMGAVLAVAGKKSVILEFDIRKPKVMSGLKMGKHKGISNYLAGNAELESLIIPVPDCENLYVLPCGPIPPNPSELLLDPRVTEMFEKLKRDFDVVIIDTAPVGMVSDAITLGKFADCTLYLTRQGHTYKKQIGLVDEMYREKKLPKVSIVINDVKLKPGYGYYGYGRYGYGYGYGARGSYYEEEVTPKKKSAGPILFSHQHIQTQINYQ